MPTTSDIKSGPPTAPLYALHRHVENAPDTVSSFAKSHGMNFGGSRWANIQVVPSAGANPNVEAYVWSDAAGAFCKFNTAVTKSGMGVNTPYEFSIEALGRIIFVAITGGIAATQKVDVYASCF